MKVKFRKFFMHPWIVSVGSGLVVLLITIIVDVITAEKIFSTFKKVLFAIWTGFVSVLNFEIKMWWLFIGVGLLFIGLKLWAKYLDTKPSVPDRPQFTEYTHDTILGFKWKWFWEKDYLGKYRIENLHPICSNCDTPLVDSLTGYGGRYTCLRCNNGTNRPIPDYSNVKIMIADNVRRRYFPNE